MPITNYEVLELNVRVVTQYMCLQINRYPAVRLLDMQGLYRLPVLEAQRVPRSSLAVKVPAYRQLCRRA